MIRIYREWDGQAVNPSQLPIGAYFDSIQHVIKAGKDHWFKVRFLIVERPDRDGEVCRWVQECRHDDGTTMQRDLSTDEIAWYSELVR